MRHGSRAFGALSLAVAASLRLSGSGAGAAPVALPEAGAQDLVVTVTGLRSGKGRVLACLVSEAAAFPDCKGHADARHLTVTASTGTKGEVTLDFGAVPAGTWAIALFHDENGNGKLDTLMMIPREGYGFSRDAAVRMGPPRFASAAFAVGTGTTRQGLKMRYLF